MNVHVNTSDKFQVYDNVTDLSVYSKEHGHELFDEMVDKEDEDTKNCHTVLTFDRGDESHTVYLYNDDKWSMS